MVSVPFYLVVLIELLILESLAIGGFFVFRWWLERQDQTVLEALLTATETSASARNQGLKAMLPEAASELNEKAESLADAEILFQKRILAAFRNRRLLSLGRLPVWTEELLVPYQSLIEAVQSSVAAATREHQQGIEREVEDIKAELTQSHEELEQSRKQNESVEQALSSTQTDLAEKTAKIESLEREYVSAFHTPLSGPPQQEEQAPAGEVATATHAPPATQATTPSSPQEEASIIIDNDEVDESAPIAPQNDGQLSPHNENPVEDDVQETGVDASTTEETPSSESEEHLILDEQERDSSSVDQDWGSALAEQTASNDAEKVVESPIKEAEGTEPEEDLGWGSALAEQAASGDVEKVVESPITEAEGTETEEDLDWGSALTEQAAANDADPVADAPIKETG